MEVRTQSTRKVNRRQYVLKYLPDLGCFRYVNDWQMAHATRR